MKLSLTLLFVALSYISASGQYIPPMFKISKSEIAHLNGQAVNQEDLILSSSYYRDGQQFGEIDNSDRFSRETETHIYLSTGDFNPEPGNIYLLTVKSAIDKREVNIYVRVHNYLAEGEIIEIKNLKLITGNYYFDITQPESQYFPHSKTLDNVQPYEKVMLFEFSKKHRISDKRLKELGLAR